MKSKLKAEIIGEFEANFLDGDKITDCGKCTLAIDEDFINFLDQVIDKAYSAGADEFIKSLGDPVENNIYLIKPYNQEWWLEHKIVGSGEPLRQALNPQSK